MSMELRDLSYFLACVDCGSVTAAARREHAAQPTISHALSRLEAELGVGVDETNQLGAGVASSTDDTYAKGGHEKSPMGMRKG